MEISQLGLFSLLIHSAVGGAFVGVFCDIWRVFRMMARLAFDWHLADVPRPIYKNGIAYLLGETHKSKPFSRIACGAVTFVADIICAITAAVMLIMIAYACNSGRMRWMLVIGLAAGFALYRVTLGRIIVRAFAAVMLLLRNLTLKMCRAIARSFKCLRIKSNISIKKRKKGGS